jgi:hypothetical protein
VQTDLLLEPMRERIEVLLKARAHWRSDDDRRAQKIFAKLKEVDHDNAQILKHCDECLTPLLINCLEQLNLQIVCEEQDHEDRKTMALYGAMLSED